MMPHKLHNMTLLHNSAIVLGQYGTTAVWHYGNTALLPYGEGAYHINYDYVIDRYVKVCMEYLLRIYNKFSFHDTNHFHTITPLCRVHLMYFHTRTQCCIAIL